MIDLSIITSKNAKVKNLGDGTYEVEVPVIRNETVSYNLAVLERDIKSAEEAEATRKSEYETAKALTTKLKDLYNTLVKSK